MSNTARHSFSLSALFVLMAAVGVIASFLAPVVQSVTAGPVSASQGMTAAFVGAAVLAVLGGCIGLHHHNRRQGLSWGVLTGMVLGVILGPLTQAPAPMISTLLSISLTGSLVLIAVAAFFRWAAN